MQLSYVEHEGVEVLAAVVALDGRYLVCRRPPQKRHGGLWEFPGGKIEPHESFFTAVRRELAEELGVLVIGTSASLFTVADPGSSFVIQFVPTSIEGTPMCIEHTELAWVPVKDLPNLDLAPGDRRFVEYLLLK